MPVKLVQKDLKNNKKILGSFNLQNVQAIISNSHQLFAKKKGETQEQYIMFPN